MATYVNDLRLKEIATGDEAGTWGTSTNTNLELIAEAFSYGTEASFGSDADATTTIADGSTDPARSLYLKVTSGASLTATRTLTIAPNTVSKVWIIENATSGSQSINISQGSGANVTIPSGKTKIVYSDGAGSGAAVVDALASLNLETSGIIETSSSIQTPLIEYTDGDDAMTIADGGQVTFAQNIIGTLGTAAQTNITSVGALNGGSITSGFGSIDVGSSAITTTGTVTGNTLAGTLSTAAQPNITSLGTLTTLTVDDITIDGSVISDSGTLTIDAGSDLKLDADSSNIYLADGGTDIALLSTNNQDLNIRNLISDKDIYFQGNDGGSTITALTLDMSDAGTAIFNNKVGIGTSSPAEKLQVNGNLMVGDDLTAGSFVDVIGAGANQDFGFRFGGESDRDSKAAILANTSGGLLKFFTSCDNERMRIDSSGNVGIGTTHPDSKLDVTGGDITVNTTGTGFMNFKYSNSSKGTIGTDGIDLKITAASDLQLLPTGNVGIGTDSPSGKIHAVAADSQVAVMAGGDVSDPLYPAFGFDGQIGSNGGRGAGMYLPSDGNLAWSTAGSERMRIDSSGKVGIGTDSPDAKTHIQYTTQATANKTYGLIVNGNDSGTVGESASILLGGLNTTARGASISAEIQGASNDHDLIFATSAASATPSEAMRIDSSGKVGIGTDNPYHTFDVFGAVIANGQAKSNGLFFDTTSATTGTGGGIALGGYSNGTGGAIYHFGNIQGIKENSTAGNYASAMLFSTRANGATPAERMRIDSSGNLLFNGNGVVSVQSNSSNFYLGGGSYSPSELHLESGSFTAFKVNGSEKMRITSSGAIGFGTTSPSDTHTGWNQLFVGQKGSLFSENATGTHGLDGMFITDNLYIDSDTGSFANIETNESSAYKQEAGVHHFYSQASGSAGAAVTLSEKMRIDASDNVEIGGTTNTGSLKIINTSADVLVLDRRGSDGTVVLFRNDDANIGGISISGSTVAYNTSSDYRLKENVDYNFTALDRVAQLKPARFNFIADETNTLVDGFLAHEVSSIVPEAIKGTKDAVDSEGNPEYQGIDQSKLVPLLTKAIQEQQTQIEALQSEINKLKGE